LIIQGTPEFSNWFGKKYWKLLDGLVGKLGSAKACGTLYYKIESCQQHLKCGCGQGSVAEIAE
jgi:hypothetical protein